MTIEEIGVITGICATIAGGLYFLFKEYKKAQIKHRTRLKKVWTNEGSVVNWKSESHFLQLELDVDSEDGEITGVLESRNLKSNHGITNVSVNGKLPFKTAIIILSDFKRGKLLKYGKVKIKMHGKLLRWKLIEGEKEYLPAKTTLWNSDGKNVT